MNQVVCTLELPQDVYERVRRSAKGMKQPVEKALGTIVRAAIPSLEHVPLEYRAELESLEELVDGELREVAARRLGLAKQRRLETLLDRNRRGELTERERRTLVRLRSEVDRLMLRRAYAALLLKSRGHRVPTLTELRP